ncbi:O-antigen ligase family protein, partial [Brasilonema sp. UFV-L1]|uniref:O-antigen ligase family protein n=1 Tax=Brasilonema sp. UFV-L1 TaxID=2234130 RepID=UPI0016A98BCB
TRPRRWLLLTPSLCTVLIFLQELEVERVNAKFYKSLLKASEIGFIFFFLIFAEAVNVPSAIKASIQLANYLFVFILVIVWRKKVAYVMTRDVSLTLLVLIALFSVFWSVDISRSLRLHIALIRVTLFGVYLATRYSVRDQVRIISWVAGLSVAINLLVCVAFPSYGIGDNPNNPDPYASYSVAWMGIYTFKQFLGRMMALAASVFLVHLVNKKSHRWLALVGFVLSVAILQFSDSRTYLVAIVVSAFLLPIYKIAKQRATARKILFFLVLVISIGAGYLVLANLQTIATNLLGKDAEFNGRLPIWTLAIEKVMERPWLGYGYGAFWGSDIGASIANQTWIRNSDVDLHTVHAHNAFLEISLQLGLIGLTLLIVNITQVITRVFQLLNLFKTIEFLWMLEFLAIQLVASMSEQPTYLSPFNVYWIFYVMIACSTARELSRLKQKQQIHLSQIESS